MAAILSGAAALLVLAGLGLVLARLVKDRWDRMD